jgi:hypothetical protein
VSTSLELAGRDNLSSVTSDYVISASVACILTYNTHRVRIANVITICFILHTLLASMDADTLNFELFSFALKDIASSNHSGLEKARRQHGNSHKKSGIALTFTRVRRDTYSRAGPTLLGRQLNKT